MLDDALLDTLDGLLEGLGSRPDAGEEFRDPALDVLRYYSRPVRVSRLPVVGRVVSVVAVVRQPIDVGLAGGGRPYADLLDRAGRAAHGRFPPWPRGVGAGLALTLVVVTPEPIGPGDDALLGAALAAPRRSRVVPCGLFRLNLGQEALAFAIAGGPGGPIAEPVALADALTERFRRFVPFLDPTL